MRWEEGVVAFGLDLAWWRLSQPMPRMLYED